MKLEKATIDPLPQMTALLLYTNIIIYLLTNTFGDLTSVVYQYFASYNTFSPHFHLYQIFSHMFLHGGFTHLFYNMLILWIFGMILENAWGKWAYLIFYFVCGIGAWALHQFVNWYEFSAMIALYGELLETCDYDTFLELVKLLPDKYQLIMIFTYNTNPDLAMHYLEMLVNGYRDIPTIGASGAVFGVLAAFGLLFGETLLYAYFIFPIKAKWFVAFFILLEVIAVTGGADDNVAHFAHIGGALAAIIMIIVFRKQFGKNKLNNLN